MNELLISIGNELSIAASENSSPLDFDFLVGRWTIRNKKLKTRLNHCRQWTEFEAVGECRKILNGFGNIDSFQTELDDQPYEGAALRLFNPETKLWSIYWANSKAKTTNKITYFGDFV